MKPRQLKVLVTGAAGMLGDALVPTLIENGYEVYATDINADNKTINYLDVRDYDSVTRYVEQLKPEIVIHLAAETDVEKCESNPRQAFLANSIGTKNVLSACRKSNALIVYTSTAGVFDGSKKEPYTELDEPNPINVYGKSKLEGEKYVRQLDRYFIIRAGWMMGGGMSKDKKFVKKIVKQLIEGKKMLHVVNDKIGTPTYTWDFSKCLISILRTGDYGTYHAVNKGNGTRFDVARKILEFLGKRDVELIPVTSEFFGREYYAPRPRSETLHNLILEIKGMNRMSEWIEALKRYIDAYFASLKSEN